MIVDWTFLEVEGKVGKLDFGTDSYDGETDVGVGVDFIVEIEICGVFEIFRRDVMLLLAHCIYARPGVVFVSEFWLAFEDYFNLKKNLIVKIFCRIVE